MKNQKEHTVKLIPVNKLALNNKEKNQKLQKIKKTFNYVTNFKKKKQNLARTCIKFNMIKLQSNLRTSFR